MNKFINKLKNNKGVGNAILGTMVIVFFIFSLAMIIDMFIAGIIQREVQNQVEMGQLYALVKTVNLNSAQSNNSLVVNKTNAEKRFRNYYEDEIDTNSFIKETDTSKYSKNFITITDGITSKYMFDDGIERTYIAAKSQIEYTPVSYFRRNKPLVVNATTRIFLTPINN